MHLSANLPSECYIFKLRRMEGSVFVVQKTILVLCALQFHQFELEDIDFARSGLTFLITHQGVKLSLPDAYNSITW